MLKQLQVVKMELRKRMHDPIAKIKVLQDKWPAAFPKQASLVRPRANGVAKTIAETFGWSVPYTRAVLMVWKSRAAYCRLASVHYRDTETRQTPRHCQITTSCRVVT
jgi:hypothetical protein